MTAAARRHARAMDLPGYPSPPTVRDIPNHAGSWGWAGYGNTPIRPTGKRPFVVCQDDNGHLWVDGDAHPTPRPKPTETVSALVAWGETGIAVYVPPDAYAHITRLAGAVDASRFLPVSDVMTQPPAFTQEHP